MQVASLTLKHERYHPVGPAAAPCPLQDIKGMGNAALAQSRHGFHWHAFHRGKCAKSRQETLSWPSFTADICLTSDQAYLVVPAPPPAMLRHLQVRQMAEVRSRLQPRDAHSAAHALGSLCHGCENTDLQHTPQQGTALVPAAPSIWHVQGSRKQFAKARMVTQNNSL